MPGSVLPPYGEPAGPRLSLHELIDTFISGGRTGSSEEAHIEDAQLLAHRMTVLAVRVCPGVILVRDHIPSAGADEKAVLEELLTQRGLRNLEPDARLGDIAAIQLTGIRGLVWDLWGDDPADAHRALERAVLADDIVAFESEIPSAQGVGMTLDELLGDLRVDNPNETPAPASEPDKPGDDIDDDRGRTGR